MEEKKMIEEMAETQPQTPKSHILSFPYRRTRMGGFDDTILISLRTGGAIKSVLRTSRSGNHGSRLYRLYPGKYLAYEVDQSNGGNLYATIRIIRLGEDGQTETEKEWQVCNREPIMTLDDLPENVRTLLVKNKDVLPLFQYVFLDIPEQLAELFQDPDQEGE